MTATIRGAPLISPQFGGVPAGPTGSPGDVSQQLATDEFVADAIIATGAPAAMLLGRNGPLTDGADVADVPVIVPFDILITECKAVMKNNVTSGMTVQVRRKAGPVTTPPTYTDLAGVGVTFISGRIVAESDVVTPILVSAGDVLNFSLSTSSGSSIIVELIGVKQ